MHITNPRATVIAGFMMAALATAGAAQQAAPSPNRNAIVQEQDTSRFGGLPVLPQCLTFAVERGDPTTGPSMLLIRMTSGCVVPWHWHTAREELLLVGGRGTVDFAHFPSHDVSAGGYVLLPAGGHHQFSCKTECLFFDDISGKFDIHYINGSGGEMSAKQALDRVGEMAATPH